MSELLKLTAFTTDRDGGNPAGVWIGDDLPPESEMQRIAADVGFSETAFLAPTSSHGWVVRYFSPVAEVPFCGHATIASGVALGERFGEATYSFATQAGTVSVRVAHERSGNLAATLVSVAPKGKQAPPALIASALDALHWHVADLNESIPPALAYAGAWHLILAVKSRERLADLEYDFEALRTLMEEHDLTTCQLIWREDTVTFHARNPFPVGGVVEDPATGASAAALGGYLRDSGLVRAPTRIDIHQGDDMGRPSRLRVDIPLAGGIEVTGTAVPI
jgi:PhzF family phenazine biosynthesis protein